MNRQEELENLAKDYLQDRLNENYKNIIRHYKENKVQIEKEFLDAIKQCLEVCNKQGKNVRFIIISILESSNITKSYELQIAFYNELMYGDNEPVSTYWCPRFLFQYVDSDMEYIYEKVREKVIRVREDEINELRRKYIVNYYLFSAFIFRDLVEGIFELGLDVLECLGQDVQILFSRYMERPMELYQKV